MNRNQRKIGRVTPRRDDDDKIRTIKAKKEIEEVLPPRNKRNTFRVEKHLENRCCYVTPDKKDEEQVTEDDDNFNNFVMQQYDFDPVVPDTIKHLKELRKVLCGSTPKVENCSQYVNPGQIATPSYIETADGSQWQNVENAEDLERYLKTENKENNNTTNFNIPSAKDIRISEVPRIKVIAEKFSKFTKNNVEVRKLEEKIVCIEYDIFDKNACDDSSFTPIQTMRAYFSIQPVGVEGKEKAITILPSMIKHKFNIADEDLGKLNDKEIEIIDSKIAENKPYLDDLKRVLKRKQAIYAKKKKSTLDLISLYEMAKRERPSLDEDFSNTNLLSKAELEEIKDLITKKCASSIHGINRRTLKCETDIPNVKKSGNVISESIFAELTRSEANVKV